MDTPAHFLHLFNQPSNLRNQFCGGPFPAGAGCLQPLIQLAHLPVNSVPVAASVSQSTLRAILQLQLGSGPSPFYFQQPSLHTKDYLRAILHLPSGFGSVQPGDLGRAFRGVQSDLHAFDNRLQVTPLPPDGVRSGDLTPGREAFNLRSKSINGALRAHLLPSQALAQALDPTDHIFQFPTDSVDIRKLVPTKHLHSPLG
mmetsp:Transcript_50458/g.110357  ORF Transcript_50458/g.110357 Transcript_50458/m.110357 type:complete len:200 (+) Transcript_50458:90-689(+)